MCRRQYLPSSRKLTRTAARFCPFVGHASETSHLNPMTTLGAPRFNRSMGELCWRAATTLPFDSGCCCGASNATLSSSQLNLLPPLAISAAMLSASPTANCAPLFGSSIYPNSPPFGYSRQDQVRLRRLGRCTWSGVLVLTGLCQTGQ